MEYILDNPAWNALIGGNSHLAFGTERVKYFDREVSPFVAFKENSTDSFKELYELIPHNNPLLFVSTSEMEIPELWKVLNVIKGRQMVYTDKVKLDDVKPGLVPLTVEDVPQMVELTKLTNPGPFGKRTIEFGHYHGVFDGDKLVSIAGQRLHPLNHAEVSAVCTHPDHLGHGYARQALPYQIHRIKATGETPFLHVRYDNDRAIQVYESLGFATRTEVYFYVLQK
ncbi:MAG: GNAT family N-acetyltransferase [Mucilaginibacter sp.]|uniref:GNAT family N-acetyltransferase n=1 Tax=Mucilaginibacter sp. TaxID=1882438 RepID=UPI0032658A7C